MKKITIEFILDDNQVELFDRFHQNYNKVKHDLYLLLKNDNTPEITIKTQPLSTSWQNENNQKTEDSKSSEIDKKADLMPEYMFAEDAAKYLRTNTRKLALYRKYQLLKFSKFGKNYVYKKTWLDEFAEKWTGYDLSNENSILCSIHEKSWRETHNMSNPRKRKR